jgi:hypothetical protein
VQSWEVRYKTRGALKHKGETRASGHYTTDVRGKEGRLYRMDDSNVTEVSGRSINRLLSHHSRRSRFCD